MPIAPITRTIRTWNKVWARYYSSSVWANLADGHYELAESEISLIQGAYKKSSAVPERLSRNGDAKIQQEL